MVKRKKNNACVAIMLFIMVAIGLMLLSVNIQYYFGETFTIPETPIAWNWNDLIMIILTISIFPFAYWFMQKQFERAKR